MSLRKIMKGMTSEPLAAEGLLYQDWTALTPCQRECMTRVGTTIQIEQEAYLNQHPEVKAMLEIFISKMVKMGKRKGILKEAAEHFTRPALVLDSEIRKHLGLSPDGPYIQKDKPQFYYEDEDLEFELRNIILTYFPPEPMRLPTPIVKTPDTVSSSFISIITSDTTLPTPEPVPTPEPTLSENMFALVSNTVDKAIFQHVDDMALRYDTAYVELSKAVEEAMEVPVIEIRKDIAQLFFNAFKLFEIDIMEKERIAAEIAWEKRMRKKLKRSLRRQNNFKGYETPPTPKSEISSHESYKIPPPRPCICHPQYVYNRYPKDRFGIYMPREVDFSGNNVTATPPISEGSDVELKEQEDPECDAKSSVSKKSQASSKR
ncbi:uncharacterized protein [Epargyreus clarus]|uniref:uncharacterized protein n=1 Tax=Epargyreus clarus TaxID=520877 RepID=UPI003C2FE9FC